MNNYGLHKISWLSIIILCLFAPIFSGAQTLTIVSAETKAPLSQVEVFVQELNEVLLSNEQGKVHINLKTANCYIHKTGFKTLANTFNFNTDTAQTIYLKKWAITLTEVQVKEDRKQKLQTLQLKAVDGMMINASKKTERIVLEQLMANKSTNNARQVYAKVPGLNVWESHGSGLNTEIGARGLSPIRTSNFNVRQNGYDISADALGYPDAYYVPPTEVVDQIQVVRGAATLQYGTQFGGMINYKLKQPSDKKLAIESRQTVGLYGYFGSFNAIGGTYKKARYYNAFQYKRGNGWRENSQFQSFFNYAFTEVNGKNGTSWAFEHTYFDYLAQQAGGLTDALFAQNHKQSIRNRNWFKVRWHLPAITFKYQITPKLKVESKSFALFALRNAVGFLGNITRVDPLENRDLLKDTYKNLGNETRVLYHYNMGNARGVLLGGVRLFTGRTTKKQGLTDDSNSANFDYLTPDRLEGSDYVFPSRNIAIFAENIFHINKKFSVTPGFRLENIVTKSEGYFRQTNTDLAGNVLFDTTITEADNRARTLVLFGLGASYKPNQNLEIYGNITQNYRGINFTDLRINNPNFRVDANLEDETGFNADLGVRGRFKNIFTYDASLFYLQYDNRIGFVLTYDSVLLNDSYRLRTNVSKSRSLGLEAVAEVDWLRLNKNISSKFGLNHYVNFAYINGRYQATDEPAYNNKKIELVPDFTLRTGLSFKWDNLKTGFQFSYTSEHFTDATNSVRTGNAVNGLIPSYYVADFFASYKYKWLLLEANVNNFTNNKYFTRRAAGYPGPGIIPADGINAYLTLGFVW